MQIERLSPDEYAKIYTPQHVFNSVGFTELNRDKAEDLHYLSVHDTKHRFGIILGERNGMLRSPFSAPFGGFTTRGVQNLERMEEAVDLLLTYAAERSLQLAVTLQPMVYDETQLSKWTSVLTRKMNVHCTDLNYHVDLQRIADYEKIMALMAEQEQTQSALDTAMERWMYLQERYEEIQAAKEGKA